MAIRSIDWDRDRFDIEFGYTLFYTSYLLHTCRGTRGQLCYMWHPAHSSNLRCCLVNLARPVAGSYGPTWCRLEKGTTYNSYIIYGDKTVLVDASHEKFRGLYMNTLKQELNSKGRTLDYIVVSHTEPDHSGEALAPPHPGTWPWCTRRLQTSAMSYVLFCSCHLGVEVAVLSTTSVCSSYTPGTASSPTNTALFPTNLSCGCCSV